MNSLFINRIGNWDAMHCAWMTIIYGFFIHDVNLRMVRALMSNGELEQFQFDCKTNEFNFGKTLD